MVIDQGRLMYDGTLSGLHERGAGERTLVVDLEQGAAADRTGGRAHGRVAGPRQWLAFPASASAAPLVAEAAARYPWWTCRCANRTSRR